MTPPTIWTIISASKLLIIKNDKFPAKVTTKNNLLDTMKTGR